ncbi:hypothetical protein [Puniceibacterium sp. IMCC21224]|uniref:hypothetical protein n=1 Tax=Puniceibacterium sp. IMCC21224 TaxID=1618204 RepID=UPI0009E4CF84|nr:hypothetical protein [Puniceibacterium sp. IMCC21224]
MTAQRRSGITNRVTQANGTAATMTNFLAIALGLVIIAGIGADYMLYGTEHLLFLGKKFLTLLGWVAFWR